MNETRERVSENGAIRIADEQAIAAVPLYYYSERGRWYGKDGRGGFAHYSDSQAKSFVAEYGFNKSIKDTQGNTPADRAMLYLNQNNRVAFAGNLAGYPAGVYDFDGSRILVTETPRLIVPKPGSWLNIRTLVESLLYDERHDQKTVFYTWTAASFSAFYARMTTRPPWPFRHCPALAMFGPRCCGKSALIDLVLTPLLGGRKADPMNYLREPKFNKDLFAASLLALDDKGASSSLAERRERSERIKDLIWKPDQRMEGKGADAVMLRPFWRLVIAGNDDDGGLQVCPALSPSLEDKMDILRAQQAEGLPETHEQNDEWAAAIRAELPAFADFLLKWKPPEGTKLDPRTRVANFWHPQIVSSLRELQPEMRLLELIDALHLIDNGTPFWEGSATEFEQAMRAKDMDGILTRIFVTGTSAGKMLSELARVSPERIKRTDREGRSHYRVFKKG